MPPWEGELPGRGEGPPFSICGEYRALGGVLIPQPSCFPASELTQADTQPPSSLHGSQGRGGTGRRHACTPPATAPFSPLFGDCLLTDSRGSALSPSLICYRGPVPAVCAPGTVTVQWHPQLMSLSHSGALIMATTRRPDLCLPPQTFLVIKLLTRAPPSCGPDACIPILSLFLPPSHLSLAGNYISLFKSNRQRFMWSLFTIQSCTAQ